MKLWKFLKRILFLLLNGSFLASPIPAGIAIPLISSLSFSLSVCLSLYPLSPLLDRWDNSCTRRIIKPSIHCRPSVIIMSGRHERENVCPLCYRTNTVVTSPDVHLLVWTGFLWHTAAEEILNRLPVSGLYPWCASDPCRPAERDR